jgi:hypothetical protein
LDVRRDGPIRDIKDRHIKIRIQKCESRRGKFGPHVVRKSTYMVDRVFSRSGRHHQRSETGGDVYDFVAVCFALWKPEWFSFSLSFGFSFGFSFGLSVSESFRIPIRQPKPRERYRNCHWHGYGNDHRDGHSYRK